MGKIQNIKVTNEEFKSIKKGKQNIIIKLNDDNIKDIKINKNIIIKSKIDSQVSKVKAINTYKTKEELLNNKLSLPDNITEDDIKKYGIVSIELKKKKHILRKIILTLLLIVIIIFSYKYINKFFGSLNTKKMQNKISDVNKEKESFVFIEINPSIALKLKGNVIIDIACINQDCLSIYNEIDIKNKNINEGIDVIYNKANELGFDTTNGVRIKTTSNLDINELDYITIEYIDSSKEKELLNSIINNDDIKVISNEDYYINLYNTLKKDSDYGKLYECELVNELSCYFKEDYFKPELIYSKNTVIATMLTFYDDVLRIFDKFNIPYKKTELVPGVYDYKLLVNLDNHYLEFNIDIDGNCDSNLISTEGTYFSWGTYGHTEGGEIYNFTLYKSDNALDLLHPNDVTNHMWVDDEKTIELDDVIRLNNVDPVRYPLIDVKELEEYYFVDKKSCNINTKTCNHMEYYTYRVPCVRYGEGRACGHSGEVKHEVIDKATYDLYNSYSNIEMSYHTEEVNGYYVNEIELNGQTYYNRCDNEEMDKAKCTSISKAEYNSLVPNEY